MDRKCQERLGLTWMGRGSGAAPDFWTEALLPHEWVFGLFLVATWARLIIAGAGSELLLYTALIVANLAVIGWCERQPGGARWRVRLLFYPVAMNITYATMRPVVTRINPGLDDRWLLEIDRRMLGETPALALQDWAHPALTEIMSLCYLLFFPYLLFSIVFYVIKPVAAARPFFAGLFTVYGLGFLGYTLVPAEGPYLAWAGDFSEPLAGGWLTTWNAGIVQLGSNRVDVFPSLHCAVSAFLLGYDRRNTPWRFRVYLFPCLGLWVSTLYLRYHYFVDVVWGWGLAALALYVAEKSVCNTRTPETNPCQQAGKVKYELHCSTE